MEKAFYSHSKLSFNTEKEVEERSFIETLYSVVCPNRDFESYNGDYRSMLFESDVVVVSEFEGYIGKGVFTNALEAFSLGMPVYVIRKSESSYVLLPVIKIERNDINDWKFKFGKVIV